MAGLASTGMDGIGNVRLGRAWQVRRGATRMSMLRRGQAGEAQRGSSWFGVVLTGMEG